MMEYYLAMKRYEVATTWINLENIVVSKRSQTQNTTHYMIPLYEMSTIGKSIGTEASLAQWTYI